MRIAVPGKPSWLALSKLLTVNAAFALSVLSASNAADTDADLNTEVDYLPIPNGCLQAPKSIAATAAWVIAIVPGDDPNRNSGRFFVTDPVPLGRLSVAECADTCAIKKNTSLFAIVPSSNFPDSTAGCLQPVSKTTTIHSTTTTNPPLQTTSVEQAKPTATVRTVTVAALILPNRGAALQASNVAALPTTTRADLNPSSEQSNAVGGDPISFPSAGTGVNEGTSDGAKPSFGGNLLTIPLAISVPLLFLVGLLTVALIRRRRPIPSGKGRSLDEANPANRRVSFPAGLPPPPRALARVRSEDLMGSVYSMPFSGTESVTSSICFSNAFTFFQGGTLRSEGSEERLSETGSFRHSPQTPGSLKVRAEEHEDPKEVAGPEPPPLRRAYTGLVSNLVVVNQNTASQVMTGHYGSTPEILSADKIREATVIVS